MASAKKNCDVASCYFCQLCLPEWKAAISAHRQNLQFKKGEVLFREGEEVKGIYFVYKGLVKVHKRWTGEKDLLLRFARDGAILGHRGLGGDNFYPISGTAVEPTTVCYFDLEFFMTSLKVNHDFTFQLMTFYAEELKESEKRMRNMVHMSVRGRLAAALLQLRRNFGVKENDVLNIPVNRQELSSYVGAAYETVFRSFGELAEANLIQIDGKDIRIKDEVALQKLATDDTWAFN